MGWDGGCGIGWGMGDKGEGWDRGDRIRRGVRGMG